MTNRENNGKGKEPKTTPVPTSPEVQGASADVKPEFPVVGTDNSNPGGSINEIRRGAALLQLGALQSAIFNNPNFSSIVTDEKGVIQIYNVGADRLLGYKADEVVNKATPADLTDPQELSERAKSLSAEHGTPIAPGF